MSSQALGEALSPEMNERLRMEVGWTEVGKGLGQVLVGYLIGVVGTVVGVALIALSLYGIPEAGTLKVRTQTNSSLWQFYIGLAILSLIGLFSFLYVAGGQFRCMMGASERQGARWFMFGCLTCLLMGPAFNIAAGIAGVQQAIDINRGPQAFTDIKYNQTGQYLKLIGFTISLLYPLSFLLFLRQTACCMHARAHSLVLSVFLMFAFPLVAVTGYYIYDPQFAAKYEAVGALLGMGWLVLGAGYLAIILIMRLCVLRTMERVRSPLDY
jgi:hypothetical protein